MIYQDRVGGRLVDRKGERERQRGRERERSELWQTFDLGGEEVAVILFLYAFLYV